MSHPLGLIVAPPQEAQQNLAALQGYDFSPINNDVARKLDWAEDKVKRIEVRAKQYLSLIILNPGAVHAPAQDVDVYWHQMILRTRWYQQFCDDVFGHFVHHNPEPTIGGEPRSVIRQTGAALKQWFGDRGGVGPTAQCNNENCNNENCNNENCNNDATRLVKQFDRREQLINTRDVLKPGSK